MVTCEWCGEQFERPSDRGPEPLYCSAAHRQAAFRHRRSRAVALAESVRTARYVPPRELPGIFQAVATLDREELFEGSDIVAQLQEALREQHPGVELGPTVTVSVDYSPDLMVLNRVRVNVEWLVLNLDDLPDP